MKPHLHLLALVWVPFLAIFAFAAPTVTDRLGDSYPHIAFHIVSPALLGLACVLSLLRLRASPGRVQRLLLVLLLVTLPIAVIGNLVELVAAIGRLADDGWESRLTPDVFGADGGLHTVGAAVTIPAHLASLVIVLVLVVVALVQRGRRAGRAVGTA